MKNKSTLLFVFFLLSLTDISFGQSQEMKVRSLSVNLIGLPFNDYSIYYESTNLQGRRLGISLGWMIANNWWTRSTNSWPGFEINDDRYPIGRYNGPQIRISYYKLFKMGPLKLYTGPELLFKHLNYKDKWFTDWFSHDDAVPVYFKRTEEAYVMGFEWILEFDIINKRLFPQFFIGIGGRMKIRDINTTENGALYEEYAVERPLGIKHTVGYYPTINIGLKFSIKI